MTKRLLEGLNYDLARIPREENGQPGTLAKCKGSHQQQNDYPRNVLNSLHRESNECRIGVVVDDGNHALLKVGEAT